MTIKMRPRVVDKFKPISFISGEEESKRGRTAQNVAMK